VIKNPQYRGGQNSNMGCSVIGKKKGCIKSRYFPRGFLLKYEVTNINTVEISMDNVGG
jgi:hypothetical protein